MMILKNREKIKNIFELIPKNNINQYHSLLTPIELINTNNEELEEPQILVETNQQLLKALSNTQNQSKNSFSCFTCNISNFEDLSSQREHFKTDWHRYNLKLKEKGYKPIDEEKFEEIILNDCSSIEGSDSEIESEEEEFDKLNSKLDLLNLNHKDDSELLDQKSKPKTPYVWFHWTNVGPRLEIEERFGFLKTILPESTVSPDVIINSLQRHRAQNWCVILIGGGHFSAAVFNNSNFPSNPTDLKPIVTKSYHRYTTRRKQGGGQSRNDQANGKAKSAGAIIRRQNEVNLKNDIKQLLINWKQYLDKCSLIWFRGSVHFNSTVMGYENAPILENDERVRKIPFTTKRPTHKEVVRCYQELTKVQWVKIEEKAIQNPVESGPKELPTLGSPSKTKAKLPSQAHLKPKNRDKPSSPTQQPSPPIPSPTQSVEIGLDPIISNSLKKLSNLIELNMPNLLPQFENEFAKNPQLTNHSNTRLLHLPDHPTILHLASKHNCTELITFLLSKGCDPSIPLIPKDSAHFPYQLASNKNTKNAFRLFRNGYPDRYDYDQGFVPPSITQGELDARSEKSKAKKKKKDKEKSSTKQSHSPSNVPLAQPLAVNQSPGFNMNFGFGFGLSDTNSSNPIEEVLTEREKRARAAEARIRKMNAGI